MNRRRAAAVTLLFGGVLVILSGCGPFDLTDPGRFWPFHKEPFTDNVPGLSTPRERVEALERLQTRAGATPPSQRERVVAELSKAYAKEGDPQLRAGIVETLGHYGTASTAGVLRSTLNDPEPEVRIAACKAWAKLGGAEATQVLGRVVSGDSDLNVRMAAVQALGATKDPQAQDPLARALDDNDPAMRRRAMLALRNLTGRDYGGDVTKWRQYLDGGNPEQDHTPWLVERTNDLYRSL